MFDNQLRRDRYSEPMSNLKPTLLRAIAVALMFIGALLAIRVYRHHVLFQWPDDLLVVGVIVTTIGIGGLIARGRRNTHR